MESSEGWSRRDLRLADAHVDTHELLGTVQPEFAGCHRARLCYLHLLIVKLPEIFPLEKVGLLVVVLEDPVNIIRHPLPHLNVTRIVKLYVLHLLVISPIHVSWIIDKVNTAYI